ncbi:putative membrane protein [Streptomyces ambofaciens ATCC 23877]|uniref:Putative membrane protein n=1 Tax=Streptomyces ambofaciens (strain ATCC 23877 / 3486 / DSM 40053 / JCM 4204 / NBRC 12836 / NRRL B-2516) TaxID=278992 RepID=A0A0K2AV50_STRA7|nr:DUF5819 family protein [Streptomyces ambofaciens]AKZ56863.1 putative membrane protein [Streptomyces ambofaciens ATCC 23877]
MDAYDTGSGARQGRDEREGRAERERSGPSEREGSGGSDRPGQPERSREPSQSEKSQESEASEPSEPSERTEGPEGPGRADREAGAAVGVADQAAASSGVAAEAVAGPPEEVAEPRTGVAALSPRYQIGAVVALAVVAVAVCAHIGLVFLHVAPSNTLTKQHGAAVDEWVFPEFEQNWKLFAPNPLQQNVSVQVRAEVSAADGSIRTTGWYDLSAEDGRAIDGNPLPSHTQQNELRRAWDFFVATHDSDNRPVGLRGTLSETYLRRIAVLRLDRAEAAEPGGVVERVQYRSRTTNVKPPSWSGEKVSDRVTYRELPWWPASTREKEGEAA